MQFSISEQNNSKNLQRTYNCNVIIVLASHSMEILKQRLPSCQERVIYSQKVLSCTRDEGKCMIHNMLLQMFGYIALHHKNCSMDGYFLLHDKSMFLPCATWQNGFQTLGTWTGEMHQLQTSSFKWIQGCS